MGKEVDGPQKISISDKVPTRKKHFLLRNIHYS